MGLPLLGVSLTVLRLAVCVLLIICLVLLAVSVLLGGHVLGVNRLLVTVQLAMRLLWLG